MKPIPSQGNTDSPLPGVLWIKLSDIDVQQQVRKSMDKAALQELADDIQAHGLMQPIIVRPNGSRYTVIAGHRRRFACEMAGLKVVPAIVGEASADLITEMQLAENLQREELNDDDIGAALTKLYHQHHSLDTVALMVNKSKPWVAKRIKLASSRIAYSARALFDQGHTEDLEIILGVSDLYQLDYNAAEALSKQVIAGKATRSTVRDALAAAKISKRLEPRAYGAPKKKAKPRPRSIPQMCRELEVGKKSAAEIIATWTDNERKPFFAAAEKAWDEGCSTKQNAHALAHAALAYEKPQFKVARMLGFLMQANEKTEWKDVQDEYVRQLQAFRAASDAIR